MVSATIDSHILPDVMPCTELSPGRLIFTKFRHALMLQLWILHLSGHVYTFTFVRYYTWLASHAILSLYYFGLGLRVPDLFTQSSRLELRHTSQNESSLATEPGF